MKKLLCRTSPRLFEILNRGNFFHKQNFKQENEYSKVDSQLLPTHRFALPTLVNTTRSYICGPSLTYFCFLTQCVDLKDKTKMYKVNLPFQGQPTRLPLTSYRAAEDFLRSDHVSFWNNYPSLSAIFLSDTANLRSYMTRCYHKNCDSVSRVTPKMIQFLQKTSDVILAVAIDATKQSCPLHEPKGKGKGKRMETRVTRMCRTKCEKMLRVTLSS